MTQVGTILVAVDFSDDSLAALDVAADMAGDPATKLVLAHVYWPQPVAPPLAVPSFEQVQAEIEREMNSAVRDKLAELRRLRLPSANDVKLEILPHRSPAQAICECAQRLGADLVVVGTRGLTGLAHLLIGSVAEKIVRHAPCNVLVARKA